MFWNKLGNLVSAGNSRGFFIRPVLDFFVFCDIINNYNYHNFSFDLKGELALKNNLPELVLKNAAFCNVFTETVEHGDIAINGGLFCAIGSLHGQREIDLNGKYVVPAFIDGHIHLESSMASPAEFARMAATHGTAAAICDPHELANVCGTAGIDYLLESSRGLAVDCFFMLPSCVPAAGGEENGAVLHADALRPYYANPRVLGLGEVMNVPGVLDRDPDLTRKLCDAANAGKHVDGHAPGLRGANL